MTPLTTIEMQMLEKVGAEMLNEPGYGMFAKGATIISLVEKGLVITNEEIKDGKKIAACLTDAGQLLLSNPVETEETDTITDVEEAPISVEETVEVLNPVPSSTTAGFEIDDDIEIPPVGPRGRRRSKYPFDKLEVGQSFHVPATEEKPDPAVSMYSTCNSNVKRLMKLDGIEREFTVRRVDETDKNGAGCRVWRTK